ncbi:MAG TPA: SH3 domain-containing protein [Paracoccaceae bacterium]|nr:SH3 domain-containing protein [Paracoccaceae bacterium]
MDRPPRMGRTMERMAGARLALILAGLVAAGAAAAQDVRPKPRPEGLGQAVAAPAPLAPLAAAMPAPAPAPAAQTPPPQVVGAGAIQPRDPTRGAVTNLPLPRYVTLKTNEGNARRGPGLTHRIDWVFTRAGMPLRITAEYENWRRVEDAEGVGGWVHFALLSGARSVLVAQDMAELRRAPQDSALVDAQAEAGVVARLVECQPDWCRIDTGTARGWVRKSALWGVEPGETLD